MEVAAINIFEVFGSIGLKDEGFASGIRDATEKGESFGSKFGNVMAGVGKAALVGLGAAATAFSALATKALMAGGDLEQSIGGIETLFKGSADTVIANAEKAYLTAGVNANDYMQQVTSFSASLLQSLGGDTEAAAKAADMAVIDMADNANKMGSSVESIQNAYQGFAKQNYTMLDNLKLGYGGTKTEMERLLVDAEKISGIEYDISNLDDVYEAIHVIQTELGITGTTAQEGMETLTGSLATAKAALDNFISGAGDVGPLVDSFGNVAMLVSDRLTELLPRLTTGLSEIVSQLIPLIPLLLEKLLPALVEGASTLINGIITALPALLGALVSAMPTVVEAILTMLPLLAQAAVDIVIALANGIAEMLPELIPVAIDAILSLVETLIDNVDLLIDAAIAIILGLADGIINALPVLIEKAPVIIAKLITAIVENAPKLLTAAVEIIKKFASGLIENLPQVLEAAGEIVASVVTGIRDYISSVIDVGKNIVEGLWEGIQSMGTWIKEKVTGFFGGIVDGVKGLLGIQSPSKVFADIGKMTGEGFVDGVSATAKDIESTMEDVFAGSSESATGALLAQLGSPDVLNAGSKMVDDIATGVDRNDALDTATKNLVVDAKKTAENQTFNSDFASVGISMIQGMINGLNNKAGSLYATIASIIREAIATANRELDSHSPSRVFMSIGENVGQGFIIGIESMSQSVSNAIHSMLDDVPNTQIDWGMGGALIPATAMATGVQSAGSTNGIAVTQNFYTADRTPYEEQVLAAAALEPLRWRR